MLNGTGAYILPVATDFVEGLFNFRLRNYGPDSYTGYLPRDAFSDALKAGRRSHFIR